jgi:uncharacterized membrane protein required for colicin V production
MEFINQIFSIINPADLVILLIIAIFGVIGLVNGFIFSVFKIAAFFMSIYIAITFYPTVAEILTKLGLRTNIENSLANGLLDQKEKLFPKAVEGAQQGSTFLDNLQLPQFLKDILLKDNQSLSEMLDIDTFIRNISTQLSQLMVNIISLIILFILARMAISLLKVILTSVAKLPIFKQIDKVGGCAFGIIEGILMIYIICTLLLLFSSSRILMPTFQAINESKIAIYFYEKNIIAGFLFPKLK